MKGSLKWLASGGGKFLRDAGDELVPFTKGVDDILGTHAGSTIDSTVELIPELSTGSVRVFGPKQVEPRSAADIAKLMADKPKTVDEMTKLLDKNTGNVSNDLVVYTAGKGKSFFGDAAYSRGGQRGNPFRMDVVTDATKYGEKLDNAIYKVVKGDKLPDTKKVKYIPGNLSKIVKPDRIHGPKVSKDEPLVSVLDSEKSMSIFGELKSLRIPGKTIRSNLSKSKGSDYLVNKNPITKESTEEMILAMAKRPSPDKTRSYKNLDHVSHTSMNNWSDIALHSLKGTKPDRLPFPTVIETTGIHSVGDWLKSLKSSTGRNAGDKSGLSLNDLYKTPSGTKKTFDNAEDLARELKGKSETPTKSGLESPTVKSKTDTPSPGPKGTPGWGSLDSLLGTGSNKNIPGPKPGAGGIKDGHIPGWLGVGGAGSLGSGLGDSGRTGPTEEEIQNTLEGHGSDLEDGLKDHIKDGQGTGTDTGLGQHTGELTGWDFGNLWDFGQGTDTRYYSRYRYCYHSCRGYHS